MLLGLGTNVGERAGNLAEAVRRIGALAHLEQASHIYESEPVGYRQQPDFWNMVLRISTDLPARQLLQELIAIEAAMGRQRSFRNAPRTIDIDILLYDDVVIREPGLEVPHPRMHERAFVLRPLLEIAPAAEHPGTHRKFSDIMASADLERAEIVAEPIFQ